MLSALCERAGVVMEEVRMPRAFITTDEGGLYYWDVETTKARALGLDSLALYELGARVVFFLEGLLTFSDGPEEERPTHYGQYL